MNWYRTGTTSHLCSPFSSGREQSSTFYLRLPTSSPISEPGFARRISRSFRRYPSPDYRFVSRPVLVPDVHAIHPSCFVLSRLSSMLSV